MFWDGGKFRMEQSNHLGVDLAETVSEPSCLGTPPIPGAAA